MSGRVVAAFARATTLLFGILAAPAESLSVTSERGSIEICVPVSDKDRVDLIFTNSMFGGDVREIYEVSEGDLVRTRFLTENAAAAEYYAWTGGIEAGDDGFEVLLADERFESIPVLVDVVGEYRLIVDERAIDLSALVSEPTSVRIEVRTQPLLLRVLGGC